MTYTTIQGGQRTPPTAAMPYKKRTNNGKISFKDFLANQGYDIETFKLIQNPPGMNDKWLLHDIKLAIELILQAKKIAVIGDYDVDGITATTIMVSGLRKIGKDALFFIPNRFKDGYGLNVNLVNKSIDCGADLVLTVDNGIAAYNAVQHAKDCGLKIIVTDHHNIVKLPPADAIVHPAMKPYPFANISGCQTAYKIVLALFEQLNIEDEFLERYFLQLSTLSIISDVMPVASKNMEINENRKWLIDGLNSINENPDEHIRALMAAYEFERVDETVLGFYVIPCINAVGRLEDATYAVNYFLGDTDSSKFFQAVETIRKINERRKKMVADQLEALVPRYSPKGRAVIIVGEEVHEGIIGLVAGKYSSGKGTVSFCFSHATKDGKNYFYKASGRNDTSISMVKMLEEMPEGIMMGFGGHKDACGLSVYEDKLDDFIQFVNDYCDKYAVPNHPYLFNLSQYQLKSIENYVNRMKPFGNGFVLPVVKTKFQINSIMTTTSGFTKLETKKGYEKLDMWIKEELPQEILDILNTCENKKVHPSGAVTYNINPIYVNMELEISYGYSKRKIDKEYSYNCLKIGLA